MKPSSLAALSMLALAATLAAGEPVRYLARAHAHNDYRHARPLLDALDHGFASLEADIFLVDGELRVGHDLEETRPGRTLTNLYLAPLHERFRTSPHASIHGPGQGFQLLVDIKRDGELVLPHLERELDAVAPMLTVFEDDSVTTGAVTVVLSGSRPIEMARAARRRLYAIDGRPEDLARGESSALMPLISASWFDHYSWIGLGPMPVDEKRRLHTFVNDCHRRGHAVRFWGLSPLVETSIEYHESGVDYINTDRLGVLRDWLINREDATPTGS